MKKILAILTLFAGFAFASDIAVSDVYVRQSAPNAKNTAVFMKIHNGTDKEITLIDAESDLSDNVELHTNLKQGSKMVMVKVGEFPIPANSSIELKPGGDHIMLFDIKEPVKADTKINLVLVFNNGEILELKDVVSKSVR